MATISNLLWKNLNDMTPEERAAMMAQSGIDPSAPLAEDRANLAHFMQAHGIEPQPYKEDIQPVPVQPLKAILNPPEPIVAQQRVAQNKPSDIDALMAKVTAMMKPGYREAHPDAAYSSREYPMGVQDIQNRPEYKNLQLLMGLEKAKQDTAVQEAQAGKYRAEAMPKPKEKSDQDWKQFEADGKVYLINSKTSEMKPAIVDGTQIAGKEAKTKGAAAEDAISTAELGIDLIDRMIGKRDKEGNLLEKEKVHGGFETYVGATMLPGLRFLEGSDTASFQGMEEQLKGQAMLAAYQHLRGTGAISNVEGKSATAALNRMSKALSEDEYIRAANEFRGILANGVERAKTKIRPSGAAPIEARAGSTQPSGAPVPIRSDAEFNALPSGTIFVGPDGKTRRKQ